MDDNNLKNVNENKAEENVVSGNYGECEMVYSVWDNPTNNVASSLKYTITGLPLNRAIQNFYIGSDNIYVTQQDGKGNFLIEKCALTGVYLNHMKINNGGHGSTLEYSHTSLNGDIYFLISTHKYYDSTQDRYYANQLGIVKFEVNEINGINSDSIKRIKGIKYANKSLNGFCDEIKSAVAAITTNRNKILIYARATSKKVQYSMYNFEEFKSQLSTVPATFQNNKNLKCEWSCTQENDNIILPNEDFQGIDISNQQNGIYKIYIASGNQAKNKSLIIVRIDYNINQNTINYKSSAKVLLPAALFAGDSKREFELEGIHLVNNELYIGVSPAGEGVDKTKAYICYVSASDFD